MVQYEVRPMQTSDLPAARKVLSLAFGTFLQVPEPDDFWSDLDYIGTRWRSSPESAFVVVQNGEVIGSNFATRWGSIGIVGPLSIHPKAWHQGLAKQLMIPVMSCFKRWKVTHSALFTFAQSQMHTNLYQKFGFWPRYLTAIMQKEISVDIVDKTEYELFSKGNATKQASILSQVNQMCDDIYSGLSLGHEIRMTDEQKLGDTVLIETNGILKGFAVMHCGKNTEAGENKAYIKFATIEQSLGQNCFKKLLNACESFTDQQSLAVLEVGANFARKEMIELLQQRAYRTVIQGVAMQSDNDSAYNRAGIYLIDDWR